MRADPDVTGVVSVVGVTPMNRTANAGRLAITLKPRDERTSFVTEVIERLKHAVAAVPGMVGLLPAGQDIQIGTRACAARCSSTRLTGTDAARSSTGPTGWSSACAAIRCCAMSPPRSRTAGCGRHQGRSREGRPARHLDAGDQRHAQRRLRPAPNLDDLRPGQSVPGHPGGDAGISARPRARCPNSMCRPAPPPRQPTVSSRPRDRRSLPTASDATVPLSVVASFERTTAPLVVMHEEQFPAATSASTLRRGLARRRRGRVTAAEREIGMPAR